MPTYIYECRECETQTELKHPIRECDEPHLCPVCGAEMQRIPQPPATVWLVGKAWGERDGWW